MKKLAIALILLTTLSTYAQKPKDFQTGVLNVQLILLDGTEISCSQQQVVYYVHKRKVVIECNTVKIDLKIIKRKIGQTKSWLGYNREGDYYFMTGARIMDEYSLMFQPVDKELNRVTGLPIVIITTAPVCQ